MARIGLIGAARRRQGLGPFVARDLIASGVEIPAFFGPNADRLDETAAALRETAGVEARGYADWRAMVDAESLDAVAILSPAASHEAHLEAALAARLHVFCEKPLLWGGNRLAARSAALVARFREAGLLLFENCQWPRTLKTFAALHGPLPGVPKHFAMQLSPMATGERILGDCLPHPISLLQAIAPGPQPTASSIVIRGRTEHTHELHITFDYLVGTSRVAVELALVHTDESPRPASYTIDGARAERRIAPAGYTMELVHGGRSVALPDPLTAHVRAFASALADVCGGGNPPDPEPIAERMELLAAVLDAYRAAPSG